jgi:hypothetical protein
MKALILAATLAGMPLLAFGIDVDIAQQGKPSPFANLSDGVIKHVPSGFLFPQRVGAFERKKMDQYDRAGADVSAGYDAGVLIAATVYVYPNPVKAGEGALQKEYLSRKGEITGAHPAAELLSENEVPLTQGGRQLVGRKAIYVFMDKFRGDAKQKLKSQLLVFQYGSNFVEYRFTYPMDHAEAGDREVERFVKEWAWLGPRKAE